MQKLMIHMDGDKISMTRVEQNAYEKADMLKDMLAEIEMDFHRRAEIMDEALAFGAGFHQYSFRNTMLLYMQNPHCQYVKSFQGWKDAGASVKRGEHGLKVFVPTEATYLKVGEDELVPLRYASKELKEAWQNKEIEGIKKTCFQVGNVFDISQTTFPKERYPELFHMGYDSEQSRAISNGLERFCKESLHCPVEYTDLRSITLRGQFFPEENRIEMNDRLEDTQRLSTLSHEVGHALLHKDQSGKAKVREQKEFEADAMSVLIGRHYGLQPTDIRKLHMGDAYRKLRAAMPGVQISECLEHVFSVYRSNIVKMDACVDMEIGKEGKLEKEADLRTAMQECMRETAARAAKADLPLERGLT